MGHPLTLVGFTEMYPTQDARRRALLEQLAGDHGLPGRSGAHALLGMPLCGFRLGSA